MGQDKVRNSNSYLSGGVWLGYVGQGKVRNKNKMKKQEKEQLKSLTWEYFIRNKLLEIVASLAFIFLTIPIGKVFGCWLGEDRVCFKFEFFVQGMLYEVGIFFIIMIVISFITENWRLAEKQAKEKLGVENE